MLENVPIIGGGQATRTWVSGVGDDANPCSRTAPCKTFAGAISKTAAGGEINVIDPGGFGAVTITKGITIDGNGTFASVLAAATNGIVINAGANDVITLRNLSLNGNGNGLEGIRFIAGGALHIENCVIFRFARRGVFFNPTTTSRLFIKDTIIRNCPDPANGGGVLVQPQGTVVVNATLDNVRLESNLFGFMVTDRVIASIRRSLITGNGQAGIVARSTAAGLASINVDTCVIVENNAAPTIAGARADGAQAVVRLSNATIMDNGIGVEILNGGFVSTFTNNRITRNGTNGTPNFTEPNNA